jgi:phosphomannomutase
MVHHFHSSILRAYDIRGIYQKTLHNQDAFFVGKSFATILHQNNYKNIVVACDGRASSPCLKQELINGLTSCGINVFDAGLGPTPMLYFAVYHQKADAGIMITGSHNPKDHNGFKIMLNNKPFFGDEILKLAEIAKQNNFIIGNGSVSKINIMQAYIDRLLVDLNIKKPLKIAFDAGNGATGEVLQKLAKQLQDQFFCQTILLYTEIDANFPNHHPDPTVRENLNDLIDCVKTNHCDLGIAFDGDGDRIGVVDGEGNIIWGDQLMVFYAQSVLASNPSATIIADVKSSDLLFSAIKTAGGNAIMWKTGHSFIKAKMQETKALLAGEMTGHVFFADKYYGFDDALYASIRLLNIVSNSKKSLAEKQQELPISYSTSEIRIETSEEYKFAIVHFLQNQLVTNKQNFNNIDGIRVSNNNGWWLIRASNTQPVLVARCEGYSQQSLELLKAELKQYLQNLPTHFQVKIEL